MCLNLKFWTLKRTAKKDIVVYKVVHYSQIYQDYDCIYTTPFQLMVVQIGETYNSLMETQYNYKNSNTRCQKLQVHKGIHSIKNLEDAEFVMNEICYGAIIQCVIPKGCEYYKGEWYTNYFRPLIGYASTGIRYVELVKKFNKI